jgi:hypothetical protein
MRLKDAHNIEYFCSTKITRMCATMRLLAASIQPSRSKRGWLKICGIPRRWRTAVSEGVMNAKFNRSMRMKIGIVGRHQPMLMTAMATAARVGHIAKGTLEDREAVEWTRDGSIEVLIIGGGVEQTSRRVLLDVCAAHRVRPVEIFGPDLLEQALIDL